MPPNSYSGTLLILVAMVDDLPHPFVGLVCQKLSKQNTHGRRDTVSTCIRVDGVVKNKKAEDTHRDREFQEA